MFNYIKRVAIITLLISFSLSFILAIPPKPGPNFVWVPKHRTKVGIIIPAHWRYKGKKRVKKRGYKKKFFNRKQNTLQGFRGGR